MNSAFTLDLTVYSDRTRKYLQNYKIPLPYMMTM